MKLDTTSRARLRNQGSGRSSGKRSCAPGVACRSSLATDSIFVTLDSDRVSPLPDGRRYVVFRESTRDGRATGTPVTLAVWSRCTAIPPGAAVRRRLFERLCILNTLLFAGFDGYLVKLWMVDPTSSDYAGLYSWASADEAERYGQYITAVLRPLSKEGSVGFRVYPQWTLADFLARRAPTS